MPLIKASELAYCTFQLPDLERADQFLVDFGLIPVGGEPGRRYYRGTDPDPYCYAVEKGSERFIGFALKAKSQEDIDRLSVETGCPIEGIDAPGGGIRVRLREPNGYYIDVVYGIEPVEPIAVKRQPNNSVPQPFARGRELYRLPMGQPTPVRRLAHVVLATPNVAPTIKWFKETLGFIASDDIVSGSDAELVGSFMRVDEGEKLVDHHAIFIIRGPAVGLQHVSFETQDLDAVFHDHHYLKSLGRYEHLWGIGRHLLGSQVFDYWASPFGYSHEHWADTDRLPAGAPAGEHDFHLGLINQWGEPATQRFREGTKP